MSQFGRFKGTVRIGDRIKVESDVVKRNSEKNGLNIESTLKKHEETVVMIGEAEGMLPQEKG